MALVLEPLGLLSESTAVPRKNFVSDFLIARAAGAAHTSVLYCVDNWAQALEMQTATVSGSASLVKGADRAVHTVNIRVVAVRAVDAIVLVDILVVRRAVAELVPHSRNDLGVDVAAAVVAAAAAGIGLPIAGTGEVSAMVVGIDQALDIRTEVGGALNVAGSVGYVVEAEVVLVAAVHYDNLVSKYQCPRLA
jgi:hypothetical protein